MAALALRLPLDRLQVGKERLAAGPVYIVCIAALPVPAEFGERLLELGRADPPGDVVLLVRVV